VDPQADAEDAARKRARTTEVLQGILSRMELPGRLEVKDGPDGGISVALFLEGEVPAGQGRRSNFVEALQFLSNKVVNRPGTSRRWISIGVGAHPEPRPPRDARPPAPAAGPAPAAAAPAAQPQQPQQPRPPRPPRQAPPAGGGGGRPQGAPQQAPARAAPPPSAPAAAPRPPEETMEVPEDAAIAALARTLATRSAELGRFYALAPIKTEDRARFLRAGNGVPGVKLLVEGEGRSRRLVFAPEKPTPMPKRSLPVHDDEA
jgi:predicted RNA-binding protein Jag